MCTAARTASPTAPTAHSPSTPTLPMVTVSCLHLTVWSEKDSLFLINNATRFIVIGKSLDEPQLFELSDELSRD